MTDRTRAEGQLTQAFTREQEARAFADEANRAKDEFLATLGHELRNPLAPMLTALELMRLRSDDSTIRERRVLERQVSHLHHLLDVSRDTRGKIPLKHERIEMAEVLARAIERSRELTKTPAARRILIVDDNRDAADMLGEALAAEGDPGTSREPARGHQRLRPEVRPGSQQGRFDEHLVKPIQVDRVLAVLAQLTHDAPPGGTTPDA